MSRLISSNIDRSKSQMLMPITTGPPGVHSGTEKGVAAVNPYSSQLGAQHTYTAVYIFYKGFSLSWHIFSFDFLFSWPHRFWEMWNLPKTAALIKSLRRRWSITMKLARETLKKNKRRTIFLEKVKKESEQKCRDRSSADYDTNDATLDICVNFLLTF